MLEAARARGADCASSTPRRARSTAPRRRVPIDEEHPLHPQSPYAASKVGADQLALSFQRSFGTPVVVARPFNTYGPRQSARAVIPTIVTQALSRDVVELGATDADARLPLRRGHGCRDDPLRRGRRRRGRGDQPRHRGRDLDRRAGASASSRPARQGRADRARRGRLRPPTARWSGSSPARRRRSACSAGSPRSTSTRACVGRSTGSPARSTPTRRRSTTSEAGLHHGVDLLVGHARRRAAASEGAPRPRRSAEAARATRTR